MIETAERTWAAVERAKAEAALRASEENFSAIVSQSIAGIFKMSLDARIIYSNEYFGKMTGYTVEEMCRLSVADLVYEEDLQRTNDLFAKMLEDGKGFEIEKRLKRKDGTVIWVLNHLSFIQTQGDKANEIVAISVDITEKKMFTQKLERLVNERTLALQRSNEDLQQFAHIASHDLKEPVRKILTFNNRVLNEYSEELPDKAKTYLQKTGNAADRMGMMIEAVLSYSKMDSGDALPMELLSLNDTIRDIETDLEIMIAEKDAVITTASSATFLANSTLIYQLFYNLVLNSLKFSKAKGPCMISISADNTEVGRKNFCRIVLSDNGIGFSNEFAKEVFQPFKRLHSYDEFPGTGLGLALCNKIVERHKGTITVDSEPGIG
ncbi:MAG: PAS domain-containing sensor histidine kinase, partial [Chitinophagaceae bacterium]